MGRTMMRGGKNNDGEKERDVRACCTCLPNVCWAVWVWVFIFQMHAYTAVVVVARIRVCLLQCHTYT